MSEGLTYEELGELVGYLPDEDVAHKRALELISRHLLAERADALKKVGAECQAKLEEVFQNLEEAFPWIWQGVNTQPWQALKEKWLKEGCYDTKG